MQNFTICAAKLYEQKQSPKEEGNEGSNSPTC